MPLVKYPYLIISRVQNKIKIKMKSNNINIHTYTM